MLKGKSIIELTDVHTGKKEIYEDENLVTEAIFDILNTNIQGAMYNSPSFDSQSGEAWLLPIYQRLTGGILLYQDEIEEDPSVIYAPLNNPLIGYASNDANNTEDMLMTQGIIDPVLYSQETNELLSQADSFRDEIEALKNEVSGDVNKVTETTALIHFAEKSAMLQEFDKDLFDRYVKRIIVHSRNDIRFELKCGLTLRERK